MSEKIILEMGRHHEFLWMAYYPYKNISVGAGDTMEEALYMLKWETKHESNIDKYFSKEFLKEKNEARVQYRAQFKKEDSKTQEESKTQGDILWAIDRLKEGKKVCRSDKWHVYTEINGAFFSKKNDGSAKSQMMFWLVDFESAWELYEEITKEPEGHDFAWALEQMQSGNSVRRKTWAESSSCQLFDLKHLDPTHCTKADWILAK